MSFLISYCFYMYLKAFFYKKRAFLSSLISFVNFHFLIIKKIYWNISLWWPQKCTFQISCCEELELTDSPATAFWQLLQIHAKIMLPGLIPTSVWWQEQCPSKMGTSYWVAMALHWPGWNFPTTVLLSKALSTNPASFPLSFPSVRSASWSF